MSRQTNPNLHLAAPQQIDSASLDDLPAPGTQRWVGRRKAAVVAAVRDGRLTLEGACERYGLSVEELMSWQRLLDRGGAAALRSTRLQQYRPATRRDQNEAGPDASSKGPDSGI